MTGILKKHITLEYIKLLAITLFFITTLFHIIDMVEHVDNFFRGGATGSTIFKFYLLRTPEQIVMFLPFALLISAVILLVIQSRFNETVAIFSSGVSLLNLLSPIIVVSILCGLLSFFLSENIIPKTSPIARDIQARYVKHREKAARFLQNRYWLKVKEGLVSAQVLVEEENKVFGFTYLHLDGKGTIIEKIDAREASYNGAWNLKGVEILNLQGTAGVKRVDSLSLDIPAIFSTFFTSQKSPSDMNSVELRKYIREIQAKGYDASRLIVDYHSRFSYLLLNVILVFLAAPFSITGPRKGIIVASVGISVIIGAICWALFSLSIALGHKGILSPLFASRAPDIIVSGLALLVYRKFRM